MNSTTEDATSNKRRRSGTTAAAISNSSTLGPRLEPSKVMLESQPEELKGTIISSSREMLDLRATIKQREESYARFTKPSLHPTTGDGKTPWDKIVSEQTERDPWTNLRGVEQSGVRGKTLKARKDYFILMLKTVFANNAAEQQKFYLTCLRYSPKMRVLAFLRRFTTL
eukprot:scaffold1404_cov37-Cyclotella_meneghiniana.AAC.16